MKRRWKNPALYTPTERQTLQAAGWRRNEARAGLRSLNGQHWGRMTDEEMDTAIRAYGLTIAGVDFPQIEDDITMTAYRLKDG